MAVDWQQYIWNTEMPLDIAKLEAVEQAWGIRFPADYRECVLINQGKTPIPDTFPFGDGYSTVFNELYHFEAAPASSNIVVAQHAMQMGNIPEGIYVFASDPAGNLLCFDYRTSATAPTIAILHHDDSVEEALIPVAESFTALLALLA